MLNLTRHLEKNWRSRVKQEPDPEKINRIISQAVRIQKGKLARARFADIKTLSIYWHAHLNIIITVDHFRNNVVSVYTKENMPSDRTLGMFQEGF